VAAAASGSARFPHDTIGIAAINEKVASLPIHRTSTRTSLRRSAIAPTRRTVRSRARIAAAAHSGKIPRSTRAISPAAIASRSATGSRILPTSDTCPVRRAIVPSTQSVATTTAKRIRPAVVVS